jgi:hypothetical protein
MLANYCKQNSIYLTDHLASFYKDFNSRTRLFIGHGKFINNKTNMLNGGS